MILFHALTQWLKGRESNLRFADAAGLIQTPITS